MRQKETCLACQENGDDQKGNHGWQCRLYLKQRAWAQSITRRLKTEPDVTVPLPPDYSTPEAVTARCREEGLRSWSKDASKRDPWKVAVYNLLASDGLYTKFAAAVKRAQERQPCSL